MICLSGVMSPFWMRRIWSNLFLRIQENSEKYLSIFERKMDSLFFQVELVYMLCLFWCLLLVATFPWLKSLALVIYGKFSCKKIYRINWLTDEKIIWMESFTFDHPGERWSKHISKIYRFLDVPEKSYTYMYIWRVNWLELVSFF